MLIDFAFSALAGVAVGLRFPVLALVPTAAAVGIVAASVAGAEGDAVSVMAEAAILGILGLQAGYVLATLGLCLVRGASPETALKTADTRAGRSANAGSDAGRILPRKRTR